MRQQKKDLTGSDILNLADMIERTGKDAVLEAIAENDAYNEWVAKNYPCEAS
jgi:hypothetical protein